MSGPDDRTEGADMPGVADTADTAGTTADSPEPSRPRRRLRAVGVMMSAAWRADRRRSLLAFGIFTSRAVLTTLFAFWLKLLLDGLAADDGTAITVAAVLLALSIPAETGLGYAGTRIRRALNEQAHLLISRQLIETMGKSSTLELHETPEHLKQAELLYGESWEFGEVIPSLLRLGTLVVRMTTVTVLLIAVHPLLLCLPLFGVPMLLASKRANGLFNLGLERAAEPSRRAEHLWDLATTAPAAKELRLFRLGPALLDRFARLHAEIRTIHNRVNRTGQAIGLACRLTFLAGYGGAIWFVLGLAVDGRATAGDVALTAVVAGQVFGLVTGSAEALSWALRCLTSAGRFVYLRDVAARIDESVDTSVEVPSRLTRGIRLNGVGYRYPSGVEALTDIDLELPAGATVAIVGENGAGKTTLVKLLAGLHRPTSGTIEIEGVDLSSLDPAGWRHRVSASFQDHARLEFTVRESVALGADDPSSDIRDPAVREALQRSGGDRLLALETLPDGLSTQLGPSWPGGIDLSSGQWQQLAIGRALLADPANPAGPPLLLLLDEPAATLDAETEHRLFERWAEVGRHAADVGSITVLVSHRFSTVTMADMIVVLEHGRILEIGTHAELLVLGGRYAELFELQAAAYR